MVGVRGSTLPALLAPLPGAAVAPAAPLAGPPLPPAGDLLEGLPVVLKKKKRKIRHTTSSTLTFSPDVMQLCLSPFPLTFQRERRHRRIVWDSVGQIPKRNSIIIILFFNLFVLLLQSLIIIITKKACSFQLSMYSL